MQEEISHSPEHNDRGKSDRVPARKAPGLAVLSEVFVRAVRLRIVLSQVKNNSE